MNEREMEVLQQYELTVRKLYRSRGAFYCETSQGLRLLKETEASEERLQWEAWILERCRQMKKVSVETYVRNKEGNFLSRSSDYRYYALRLWQEGQECERDCRADVLAAVEALALLHQCFAEIKGDLEEWEKEWHAEWERKREAKREAERQQEQLRYEEECSIWKQIEEEEKERSFHRREKRKEDRIPENHQEISPSAEEMKKRTRELVRAKNYIRKIRRKSELELLLLEGFARYLPEAEEASRKMQELTLEEKQLCHGDYVFHHLYRISGGMMITGFEHMHHGVSLDDLYLILRKSLENQDWDIAWAEDILETYEKIRPMTEDEKKYLYLRLAYPEKFWKQVNFYLNHRKSWISARNLEKMHSLEVQREKRNEFLSWMEKMVFF
ncbi:MAG: hypothetical protein PUB22_07205 [Clostridiales bacterium]|nr:hypothetical protein [Clostridiales bacterium]